MAYEDAHCRCVSERSKQGWHHVAYVPCTFSRVVFPLVTTDIDPPSTGDERPIKKRRHVVKV